MPRFSGKWPESRIISPLGIPVVETQVLHMRFVRVVYAVGFEAELPPAFVYMRGNRFFNIPAMVLPYDGSKIARPFDSHGLTAFALKSLSSST